MTIPAPFLRVAVRLVYEQARLALPPSRDDVWALAERLHRENRGRPQAAQWEGRDWVRLARLVLANRRIPTAALFAEKPPDAEQIIREVEIPFAARYVEEPLEEKARQLRAPTWSALLERAEELLNLVADEVEEARTMLADLRASASLLRRPPGRSNSANPSQELCESRSNSAKSSCPLPCSFPTALSSPGRFPLHCRPEAPCGRYR